MGLVNNSGGQKANFLCVPAYILRAFTLRVHRVGPLFVDLDWLVGDVDHDHLALRLRARIYILNGVLHQLEDQHPENFDVETQIFRDLAQLSYHNTDLRVHKLRKQGFDNLLQEGGHGDVVPIYHRYHHTLRVELEVIHKSLAHQLLNLDALDD